MIDDFNIDRCKLISSIILFCTLFCGLKFDEKLRCISAIEDELGRCQIVFFLSNNLNITYDELKSSMEYLVDDSVLMDYIIDLMIAAVVEI